MYFISSEKMHCPLHQPISKLYGEGYLIFCALLCAIKCLISTSHLLYRYDVAMQDREVVVTTFHWHAHSVRDLCFTTDGTLDANRHGIKTERCHCMASRRSVVIAWHQDRALSLHGIKTMRRHSMASRQSVVIAWHQDRVLSS